MRPLNRVLIQNKAAMERGFNVQAIFQAGFLKLQYQAGWIYFPSRIYLSIMKKYILLFVLLGAFLYLALSFRSSSVTDLYDSYIINPVPQDQKERVWKELTFDKIGESRNFISSSHMRIGDDNTVFLADDEENVIRRFSLTGEQESVYGLGEGRGPGEAQTIIDLHISADSTVWLVDDMSNRVTMYDLRNSDQWEILELNYAFNKIFPIGSDRYWVEKKFDSQMKIMNFEGKQVGQVQAIVDDPELWAYVLEGFFALVPNRGVVQVQYHTNHIIQYDSTGDILFFREPIAFQGLPDIEPYYANDFARVNTVDYRTWEQVSSDPQIVGDEIHIFVKLKSESTGEWEQGIIDAYSLDDGDYLYSYELPAVFQSLAISENYLAGIDEEIGKLVFWSIN